MVSVDQVPKVDLDQSGNFKYILLEIKDQKCCSIIVRGYARYKYHSDIFNEVQDRLKPIECQPLGGGKISLDAVDKRVHISGFSQGYGKADHELAARLIRDAYPNYKEGVSEASSTAAAVAEAPVQSDGPLASDRDLFIDDDGSGLEVDESSGSGWGPGPGVDDEDARGSGDHVTFPEDDEDFARFRTTQPPQEPSPTEPSSTPTPEPPIPKKLPPVDYDEYLQSRNLSPSETASERTGGASGERIEEGRSEQPDIDVSGEDNSPAVDVHEGAESRPHDSVVHIMNTKNEDRATSFFAQPGILAAVIGGAVVGLLCAILVVMFIVYRMRKKDEGSYALDEPKRSPAAASYGKGHSNREFYA